MTEPFLGTVMIWAPNFAPRGWAFCQGQLLSISTNTALFSLLGTVYGGNGTTNFGLPNLAGRIPVGQGQSPGTTAHVIGQMGGTENVTLLQPNLPPHSHTATLTGAQVSAEMVASQSPATTDMPAAGSFLADVQPPSVGAANRIYVPSTDTGTKVALGGISASMTGGTVQIGLTGNAVPVSIMQPFQVLNYVIALEGVFPSRN